MQYAAILLTFLLSITATTTAWAAPGSDPSAVQEEIVITLDDLDLYAAALLRIYALSNEISLRVAAKKEDLKELHGEFVSRVDRILKRHHLTIPRYNEIERSSQLIPAIMSAVSERVRASDPLLQKLAKAPKTMADAERLLKGKVDYPINEETMPWFAEPEQLQSIAEDYMSGPGGLPKNGLPAAFKNLPDY